jgi:phosphatidylcholine synthase
MLVHVYTASGMGFAFAAAVEIASPDPRPRMVFLLFAIALFVDGTDGPLARRFDVKRWAPEIDGRTIDDIVDYLTFTFLPLLLIWRMGWVPEPALLWLIPPLIASLFGFANEGAKDEERGFFLGFPSYWNAFAVYAGIFFVFWGPWPNAVVLLLLAILSIVPVRFVYPNLAPRPWGTAVSASALIWLGIVLMMMPDYPHVSPWLVWLSLLSPLFYVIVSAYLWRRQQPESLHGQQGE